MVLAYWPENYGLFMFLFAAVVAAAPAVALWLFVFRHHRGNTTK